MQYRSKKSDLTPDQLRDLVMRVTSATLSPDIETSLKGQVGRELIDDIIAFRHKVLDPMTDLEVGEIDVETSACIIEVTNQSEGLHEKLLRLKIDPLLNPEQKKIVLYAPNYSQQAAREVVEESIPVIQSLERLSAYVKKQKMG
jgi:hypothetical protein